MNKFYDKKNHKPKLYIDETQIESISYRYIFGLLLGARARFKSGNSIWLNRTHAILLSLVLDEDRKFTKANCW